MNTGSRSIFFICINTLVKLYSYIGPLRYHHKHLKAIVKFDMLERRKCSLSMWWFIYILCPWMELVSGEKFSLSVSTTKSHCLQTILLIKRIRTASTNGAVDLYNVIYFFKNNELMLIMKMGHFHSFIVSK